MTNILLLPQLEASFRIARNADWVDSIVFPPPPVQFGPNPMGLVLDISDIDFFAQVRVQELDPNILLDLSTINGGLVNGGATGKLSWHVSHADIRSVPLFDVINSAVMDILAVADGNRINLFQEQGPAAITVHHGVTLLPV